MRKYRDGTRKWYLNGKLHREDGPAIEWAHGTREWWYRGNKRRFRTLKGFKKASTIKEFQEAIKLLQIQEVQES